jgi:hypothetical protein
VKNIAHAPACTHTGPRRADRVSALKIRAFNLNCPRDPKQCQLAFFMSSGNIIYASRKHKVAGRGLGSVVRGSRNAVDSPADWRWHGPR